jgi:hypothetical protein
VVERINMVSESRRKIVIIVMKLGIRGVWFITWFCLLIDIFVDLKIKGILYLKCRLIELSFGGYCYY